MSSHRQHPRLTRIGKWSAALTLASVLFGHFDFAQAQSQGRDLAVNISATTACTDQRAEVAPLSAGRSRLAIVSPCRAGELVMVGYGPATFIRSLDLSGRLVFDIDCFLGTRETIRVVFEDQTKLALPTSTDDLGEYTKVAVVWSSRVSIHLHAYEFAAGFGEPGHISWRNPRSEEEARNAGTMSGRGAGFISTVSMGSEVGTNYEVYTFVHRPGGTGTVKIAADYSNRGSLATGEHCGDGRLASIPFSAWVLHADGRLEQFQNAFGAVPCGTAIPDSARYSSKLIPDIAIRSR